MRSFPNDSDLAEGLRLLDGALKFGGLENLKTSIMEYRALQERISVISTTLRSAGAE
jgi:hypothetical protein